MFLIESDRNRHAKGRKGSQKQKNITVNVRFSQYTVLQKATKLIGWKFSFEEPRTENWDVFWADSGMGIDKTVRIAKSFQRINHFPGMVQIYRKNRLAKSIMKMQKINMSEYSFSPKTWLLPFDQDDISRYLHSNKEHCVIIKPVAGAQGRGITLAMASTYRDPAEPCVVQSYVSRPLLIDGYKFDMRIYVLVTSCDPLRVLIYKEGLCRLCTTLYSVPTERNINNTFMHLTNYSVNKHNTDFVQNNDTDNEDGSSKRSLSWLWGSLAEEGHDPVVVWSAISDIVVKTLISVQAPLAAALRDCKIDGQNKNPFTCFELLGFDIMLTASLTPVLIEVNHMPSLKTDSTLDAQIKQPLLENVLSLLGVTAEERHRHLAYKQMASQMRLYGDLYDHNQQRKPVVCDSPEDYWKRYLLSERRNIGDFQLIYPTNQYAHQPTRGRQEVYDALLSEAAAVFESMRYSVGSGSMTSDGDQDDDSGASTPLSPSPGKAQQQRGQQQRDSHNVSNGARMSGIADSFSQSLLFEGTEYVSDYGESNRARHVRSVIARSNRLLGVASGGVTPNSTPTDSTTNLLSVQQVIHQPLLTEKPFAVSTTVGPPRTADVTRTSGELRGELAALLKNNWELIRTIDEISGRSGEVSQSARSESDCSAGPDSARRYDWPDDASIKSSQSAPHAAFAPTKPIAALSSPGRTSGVTHRKLTPRSEGNDHAAVSTISVDRCSTAALVQIVQDSRHLSSNFSFLGIGEEEDPFTSTYSEESPDPIDYAQGGGDQSPWGDEHRPLLCGSAAQSVITAINRNEQKESTRLESTVDRAYDDFMTSVDALNNQPAFTSSSSSPLPVIVTPAPSSIVHPLSPEDVDSAYAQYREYRRQYLLSYRSGQAAHG